MIVICDDVVFFFIQALVVDAYLNKPKNGDPISGPNRVVNFVACLFANRTSISTLEGCANQKLEPDDYRTYIEYIRHNTQEVRIVFDQMRLRTLSFATNGQLTRVPLVTVNNEVDYNAFDDLVQEACTKYTV